MIADTIDLYDRLESEVRGYCRSFPTVFVSARGSELFDIDGRRYIDFLAGAGTLNYGHNHPALKKRVIEYLQQDGLLHGLDMHTQAKSEFLQTFEEMIFFPREQDYKMQFTGPTGTNAVEAAFKLARKITGRHNIISFTNGFHGVTLGSVAATGNSHFRNATGVPLHHVSFMPYDGYMGEAFNTIDYLQKMVVDNSSGIDLPAAVIVETVQGEGGINVASNRWLQDLETLCREHEILLIVDDIQMGCGRTGGFFSFERAGISPDLMTLSKSLSGIGLPMAVLLIKSSLDQWQPGEHNGTFRGNNLAFVAATEALRQFWHNDDFSQQVQDKGRIVRQRLKQMSDRYPELEMQVRGRGMAWGLACPKVPNLAASISRCAFERGLIIETSGTDDHVLKILSPLTIDVELLNEGMEIVEASVNAAVEDMAADAGAPRFVEKKQ